MHKLAGLNKNPESNEIESYIEGIIEDIIQNEVYLRDVPYGGGDSEKDPKSVKEAAIEIVKMLKDKGII